MSTLYDYLTIHLTINYNSQGQCTPVYQFWANYNTCPGQPSPCYADRVIRDYNTDPTFDWDTGGYPGGPYQLFVYVKDINSPYGWDTFTQRYNYTFDRHCDVHPTIDTCPTVTALDGHGNPEAWSSGQVGEQRAPGYGTPTVAYNTAYVNLKFDPTNDQVSNVGDTLCTSQGNTIYEYWAVGASGQAASSFTQSGFQYWCGATANVFGTVLTTSPITCPLGGGSGNTGGTADPEYKGCYVSTSSIAGLNNCTPAFEEYIDGSNNLHMTIDTCAGGYDFLDEQLSPGTFAGSYISAELAFGNAPPPLSMGDFVHRGMKVNMLISGAYYWDYQTSSWQQYTLVTSASCGSPCEVSTATTPPAYGAEIYCDRPIGGLGGWSGLESSYEASTSYRGTCN